RGSLLYTWRSLAEGGESDDGTAERTAQLTRAAAGFDFVDLEGERDTDAELLAALPTGRRGVLWRGAAGPHKERRARNDWLSRIPARFYKLVTESRASGDELRPLALLKSLG